MPDTENGNNTPQTTPPSGTPPPTSDPPSTDPAHPTDFRWGDDAPYDWRGQPADYAVNKYNELVEGIRQYASQVQQAQPTPSAEPPVTRPKLDPDLIVTDPEKWQNALSQELGSFVQQTVTQATAPAYIAAADSAKALSKSDPEVQELWKRFGDDVDKLAQNPAISPQLKANKAFWDNAVRAIASQPKNFETIVAERAASLAQSNPGLERGGVGGNASPSELTALDKLKETAYGKRLSERYSDRELLRLVEDSGETLTSFTEKAAATHITVNPDNRGEWTSKLGRAV